MQFVQQEIFRHFPLFDEFVSKELLKDARMVTDDFRIYFIAPFCRYHDNMIHLFQKYIAASGKLLETTTITQVKQGVEPRNFTSCFKKWDKDRQVGQQTIRIFFT